MCLCQDNVCMVVNATEDKIVPADDIPKTIELPGKVKAVGMDGGFLFAALEDRYIIYNILNGKMQDLFPFEGTPLMIKVAKVSTKK